MGEDLNPESALDGEQKTFFGALKLHEESLAGGNQEGPAPLHMFRALAEFGCANLIMRQKLAGDLEMGVTDTQAIQTVLSAAACGTPVTAAYLAHELQITTASTTKLLNRLTAGGYLVKSPNEQDARSVLITATPAAVEAFTANLTTLHGKMVELVKSFSAQEQSTILSFLEQMTKVYNPEGLGSGNPLA